MVNLAGCEAINARRQLIEHAHDGHPQAPRWDASSDFLGYQATTGGTLIDPKRVAYVAAKQSEKAKIINATLKAREANAAWLRRGLAVATPDPAGAAAGAGAGAAAAAAAAKIKAGPKGKNKGAGKGDAPVDP